MENLVVYKGIPCKLLAAEEPLPYKTTNFSHLILFLKPLKKDLAVGVIQLKS